MARIGYVDPNTIEDEDIKDFFEEARRVSTPRPEIQAVRAHQPDVIRTFMWTWKRLFKGGIVDFQLKELVRVRVAASLSGLITKFPVQSVVWLSSRLSWCKPDWLCLRS